MTRSKLLLLILLSWTFSAAHSQTVVVYPEPTGLPAADVGSNCTVTVAGNSSFVYKGGGVNYTNYSASGPAEIAVTFPSTVYSADVRPLSYNISPTVSGNTVSFTLQTSQKVSVEINGSTTGACVILAHPLEGTIPSGSNVLSYTTPGVYNLNGLASPGQSCPFTGGINTLYVAGGVYLRGAIDCTGLSNITIQGRGVISGEGFNVPTSYLGQITIESSTDTDINGVTVANAPMDSQGTAYGITLWKSSGDTVTDIALLNQLGTNHTGLHEIGSSSIASNDFVTTGDDGIIIDDGGSNSTFRDIVLWSGGDAIEFGWNQGGSGALADGINIIHYNDGNYDGTQAAIGAMAYCNDVTNPMHDITVENVNVEGSIYRLFGIATNVAFCSYNPTQAPIYNVSLANITAQDTPSNSSVISQANATAYVSNIAFSNLSIDGTTVNSASAANLSIGSGVSNVTFAINSNLTINPGFETGFSPWSCGGGCAVLTPDSSHHHSGNYSIDVTARTNEWMGPGQTVTNQLIQGGQHSYTLSAAILLASGSDTGEPTLKIVDGAGTHYYYVTCAVNSSTWEVCSGTQSVTWTGNLQIAYFYVQTTSSNENMWVDDTVLQ